MNMPVRPKTKYFFICIELNKVTTLVQEHLTVHFAIKFKIDIPRLAKRQATLLWHLMPLSIKPLQESQMDKPVQVENTSTFSLVLSWTTRSRLSTIIGGNRERIKETNWSSCLIRTTNELWIAVRCTPYKCTVTSWTDAACL